jgi:hypothetical protein
MNDLISLSGTSEPARRLLTAAVAELDGPELAHELRRWCNLGTQRREAQMWWAWSSLTDAVRMWQSYELTGELPVGWTFMEIHAEILGHLHELTAGQPPCKACMDGWLTTVDRVGSRGACERHAAVAA